MLNELKRLIKSPYFWLYIGAAAVFFVAWYCFNSSTFKIISIILVLICQCLLNTKVLTNTDTTNTFFKWTYFFVLLLFAVAYLAASLQEADIATATFIFAPYVLTLGLLIPVLLGLWESKSTHTLIISYVILAVLVITVFAYSFAVLSLFEGNEVEWVSVQKVVTDPWALLYFSTEVFYSNCFGDIVTLGFARLLASIELVTSAIIHIIIVGMVISRINTKDTLKNDTTLSTNSI